MAHYTNKFRFYTYSDGTARIVFEDVVDEGTLSIAQTSVVMTQDNAEALSKLIELSLAKLRGQVK